MNAQFIFSDKTTAFSEIIIDDASRTEVFYNDLKHADNSCRFKIPYSIPLVNKIKADLQNNVKCFIKNDNGSNWFCGYIRKTVSFEKTQQNQPVSLELVSPSFLLDVSFEKSTVYINKTVAEIVTALLALAGFSDIKTVGVTDTVSVCSFSEDDNIKDAVDELLHEYNKTYDFDSNGYFYTASILDVPDTAAITQAFTGANIRESVKIDAKERDADYVEASWNEIEYRENTLLFSDTSGQTSGSKCKIEIKGGKYFADTPYNYLTYDSTYGDVVYVSSITPKIAADKGITWEVTRTNEEGDDLGTQCMLTAKNGNADEAYITQLDIYGNAYINTGTNTNVSTTGTKKKTVTLDYLHDETAVRNHTAALANYYRYADNTVTLKSAADYACGSFVSVSDYGTGTYYGRIIQKVSRLDTKAFEYKIETVSTFTPAEVGSTKSVSNVSNAAKNVSFSDFTAPSVPAVSSLSLSPEGWITAVISPASDTESGVSYYRLYRKEEGGTFCVLTTLDHTGENITFTDKTALKGKSYSYCVSAADKVGNTSAQSEVKTITASVTSSPNIAADFTASAQNADFIKLTWTAAPADTDENKPACYIVSLSRDGGTAWTVCGKCYGTVYYYYYDRAADKYPEAAALKNYRFRLQTVSVNGIASVKYAAAAADYSVYGTWIPAAPAVRVSAEKDGIRITWTDTDTNYYGSTTYTPVVSYSGTARTVPATKEKSYFYAFDRSADGYPEKASVTGTVRYLKNYSIAVRASDVKGGNSTAGSAAAPDESGYLQWLPSAPVIQSSVSGRNITLIFSESPSVYGTMKYRVQIKKLSAAADTAFYKPDISSDPYASVSTYKVKEDTGYVTSPGSFSQTVPLTGQDTGSPVLTSYQYSVTSENESGAGTAASTVTVSAIPTGAADIVNTAVTEGKLADDAVTAKKLAAGAVTAESLAAFDLAATNAYISRIAGNKGIDANNYWSGLDGTTPEFRIGNDIALENSDSDSAEYFHYSSGNGIKMKLSKFVVGSTALSLKGLTRLKNSAATDANAFMIINPTSTYDNGTSTPTTTVNIKGNLITTGTATIGEVSTGTISSSKGSNYILANSGNLNPTNYIATNSSATTVANYIGSNSSTSSTSQTLNRFGDSSGVGSTINYIASNTSTGKTTSYIGNNSSTGSTTIDVGKNDGSGLVQPLQQAKH